MPWTQQLDPNIETTTRATVCVETRTMTQEKPEVDRPSINEFRDFRPAGSWRGRGNKTKGGRLEPTMAKSR